ncbi:unnamed protein product [Cuscuta campestris]|uniref:Uncharacterized protein n=1 Tax=Cuscuta campestris TaxID=132261 RepID=A0A484MF36_9ASTE|nr:unnamed protein product [Cuscuta campestris]
MTDERAGVGETDIEMEKENSLPCNYTQPSMRHAVVAEKEALNSSECPVKKVGEIIKMATSLHKQPGGVSRTTQTLPKSQTSHEESHKTGEVLRQTQSAVPKAPLVEWTDEQLSQLFAGDGLEDLRACKNRTGQQECKETEEVLGKSQPLISKTSFPEWTDEQLYELFAGEEMEG